MSKKVQPSDLMRATYGEWQSAHQAGDKAGIAFHMDKLAKLLGSYGPAARRELLAQLKEGTRDEQADK